MPSTVRDIASIDAPQNPTTVLQDTILGNNFSRTQLDVAWSGYSGAFNSAINQHIEDIDFLTTYRIDLDFHADIDLLLNVEIDMNYSTPVGQSARVAAGFSVRNDSQIEVLINSDFRGGNGFSEPAAGNFALHEQIYLANGSDYEINVSTNGESLSVSSFGRPIDITGFVNFSIQPVPEPGSASLICVVAMGLVGRRPRRR